MILINEQDWSNIKKALNDISMPLSAHQAIANIINLIEGQCKHEDKPERSETN